MIEKTIQDYYDQIHQEFPNIPMNDIKRILLFGYKSLYLNNSFGCDVLIQRKNFWIYFGSLMKDSLKYFEYYKMKLKTKIRVLYKRNKVEWDGYYYFALSQKLYNEYIESLNKKGRPKKWRTFNNVVLYKIYDECNISESGKVAIFRIPYLYDDGFIIYKETLKTDKLEFVEYRDPLKFIDLLKSNYNYLWQRK